MFSQILAGEEQAALQAHAVLLQGDIQHPARPPGTGRRLHLPGTDLHQGPGLGIRLLGRAAHIPQHLIQIQRGKSADHRVPPRIRRGGWSHAVADLLGHLGIIHGVEMDAVHPGGNEVRDLVDGIGDARLPQGLGVVAVPGQQPGKLPGQGGTAHGHHALDGTYSARA